MGNVPTKEDRQLGNRRRGNSITSTLSSLHHQATQSGPARLYLKSSSSPSYQKKISSKEKERFKEAHAQGLIVKYDENVDGGYLAPYGVYNLNLDYKISVVKEAIIERRIAPFYTPLQDHEDSWSDEELLRTVDSLKLHALPHEAEDEDEDLDYDAEAVDESLLSKKELRRHQSRKLNKELKLKRFKWQEDEEKRYRAERGTSRQAASRGLKLSLYKKVVECPICFLYYPKWINYSRCCNQAICSECFVQIKRLDPHYPHDTDEDIQNGVKNDPNLLISEPASCPYCATPNFGVTYQPPTRFRTGLGGIAPGSFKPSSNSSNENNAIIEDEEMSNFEIQDNYFRKESTVQRRGSLPPTHAQVVTTDYIRPDWQQKLTSARAKLAKRAAAASAIHASNLLIRQNEDELERKMIEEAMRLSLLDEETRKRRESSSRR